MTRLHPAPQHVALSGIALVLVLSAGACSDESSDPTAVLVAEETRAALQVATELPSLPELVEGHRVREQAARDATDRWLESWTMGASDGRALRNQAYALAGPALGEAMSDPEVVDLLRAVDEAVASAESLGAQRPLPEPVTARIQGARRLVDDAYLARERGERVRAIRLGLASGDRLRSLHPRRVVRRLLHRAREALRRNRGLDTYTPQELRRAHRLIRGARQASKEGDLVRAVRRAFYACQVLGLTFR